MAETTSGGSTTPTQHPVPSRAPDAKGATAIAAHSFIRVGPLTVRAEAADVAAFAQEAAAPLDGAVPFTFPVRWFAHPDIRAAGTKLIDCESWVPIHESQSFDYDRPLDVEIDYQMTIEVIRELEPSRLILRAEIGDANPCLRAEMVLRIIATSPIETNT